MIKIHKIKLAQDEPITVSHLQLMQENNEFIKRYWNNQIFSTTWNTSQLHDSSVDIVSPLITLQGGSSHYEIHIIGDWPSSSETWDILFTVNSDDYKVEVVFNGSIGIELRTAIISIDSTAIDLLVDKSAVFTLDNCSNTFDLYYLGLFAEYDDIAITTPQIGEPSTDISLLSICESLNTISYKQKFIIGWVGSDSLISHTYPYTAGEWYLFHWLDEADKITGTTKQYEMALGILNAGVNEAYTYLSNSQGTSTSSKTMQMGSINRIRNAKNSFIEQVSADETAPTSTPFWNFFKSSLDKHKLKSFALFARDGVDTVGRSQSLSGTSIDPAYYSMVDGETITTDMINALAQKQFNNLFLKAGNISAMVLKSGAALTLGVSPLTIQYTALYTKRMWFVGIKDFNNGHFNFNCLIKNNTASSVDYTFTIEGNDTAVINKTIGAGTVAYISEQISFERAETEETIIELMELRIHTNIPATATLYSVAYSPMLTTETY